jgi:hypothetical protein
MGTPGYEQEALMYALIYLLKNKAEGLCFVQMSEEHRILWLRTYLSTTYISLGACDLAPTLLQIAMLTALCYN